MVTAKDRPVDPRNRIKRPCINSLKYSPLIFGNEAKAIQQRKNSHSAICKEKNLDIIHIIQKVTKNRL